MPRIRTLKPEHRQHRKVGPFTDQVYRLWVSMILEADDHGRLVCDAGQLRAVTWPYHSRVTIAHVEAAIQRISASGMVHLYLADGVRYAEFVSWKDHQRISHPAEPKLPSWQDSGSLPNPPEHSTGKGMEVEGKGMEVEGKAGLVAGPAHTNGFQIPESVTRALDRAPRLGRIGGFDRLREDAAWWYAETRAHPELDVAACVLGAESWLVTYPLRAARKKDAVKFLHNWFKNEESG